jgi:hypothetical protein
MFSCLSSKLLFSIFLINIRYKLNKLALWEVLPFRRAGGVQGKFYLSFVKPKNINLRTGFP